MATAGMSVDFANVCSFACAEFVFSVEEAHERCDGTKGGRWGVIFSKRVGLLCLAYIVTAGRSEGCKQGLEMLP